MKKKKRQFHALLTASAALLFLSTHTNAHELIKTDTNTLNLNITAVGSVLTSKKSYAFLPTSTPGSKTWEEGYIQFGFSGSHIFTDSTSLYSKFSAISTGDRGDGDISGFSDGTESRTDWEDAFVGWKSGDLFSAFGKDGVDISVGRQGLAIGRGFVVWNDGFNAGRPLGSSYNTGGAYYLAPRKAFAKTAILRLGGSTGWRSDFAYLKSGKAGQGDFSTSLFNLEHIGSTSTFGFMYIKGLGVANSVASESQLERDGMNLYNLRASTTAVNKDLELYAEYTYEDKINSAYAGYAEAAYTFSSALLQPTISYRFTRYSEDYDPLFYGLSEYGNWYQGEVAGNFAGPANTNSDVNMVKLKLSLRDDLSIKFFVYDFDTINKSKGNTDANEFDIAVEWTPSPAWYVSPTFGVYKPKKDAESGGTQLGDNNTNIYSQLTVAYYF